VIPVVYVAPPGYGQQISQVVGLIPYFNDSRRQLSHFSWWWLCGIVLVVLVFYLSLVPVSSDVVRFKYSDKVGHFFSYFILMSWFVQLYQGSRHLLLLAVFIAMGVLIELLQGQTTYRLFEYADIAANSLGALFAWGLARTAYASLLLRLEQRFLKWAA